MSNADRDACTEVVLLLPWLASGAIDAADRQRVEKHLERCPACRAEADLCRLERERLRAEAAPAAAPHPAQLAALLARLDEAPGVDAAEGAEAPSIRRRRRALWSATPRAARWLIAAQLAALAGLGYLAATPAETAGAGYRTLSAPVTPAAAHGVLRVVFAPGTSEAELRALLLSVRAQIVAGPSAVGAYTLALDGGGAAEPVEPVLELLRADVHVRLAEPVVGHDALPR